jgi:cytoskeletal protein CcmA (bactofilin family)
MAITGLAVVGRPFALWPATLQVMPGGVLDAGFGRFFVGVLVSNTSAQAWPPSEIRLSARGRQILAAAGIAVGDGLSLGDGAALAQAASGEWIAVPALAAGAAHAIFLKLDVSAATVGVHTLELEQREPTSPQSTLTVVAPLFVARTSGSGSERVFRASCDRGTLTASLNAVSVDQESFRRVLGRARAIAGTPAPGVRTPAETERLRQRLRAVLCGEESDVCEVLADLTSSCALPPGLPPGPQPASGLGALSIFSTTATNLADRTRIADGSVGSNGPVNIGNDGIINGNVRAGGDVQVGDRTRVQGDVTTAGVIRRTPTGGSVIAGAAKERVPVTPLTIATKTVTPGASDLTVANDATQTINPGSYKIVTLRARSKVTLSTGTYHMAQLIVEPDVTLTFNQPTGALDVRVRDNLSFGDRVVIKAGASTAPGALAQFYSHQSSELRVGTDIVLFPVALSAPNGTIHVYSRTNVIGSLQGKTVTLEPDTGTARVPTDDWLGTGSAGLELLGYATGLGYSIAYKDGFFGTTGPLAFGALPWKVLLASALLQFDLGLAGSVGAELIAMAEKAVIGNIKTAVLNAPVSPPGTAPSPTQAGSVDAAVVKISGKRALGYPLLQCLDAAPGEPNAAPVSAFGGTFALSGQLLTNAEISALIAAAGSDPQGLKVHKSGAGTGVTRGLISALVPVSARDDATGTLHFINQLVIVPDPAAPAPDGRVAGMGDSGALWVQTRSNKLVGLAHSAGSGAAVVSRIEDVVNALQVQFA